MQKKCGFATILMIALNHLCRHINNIPSNIDKKRNEIRNGYQTTSFCLVFSY